MTKRQRHYALAAVHQDLQEAQRDFHTTTAAKPVELSKEDIEIILGWYAVSSFGLAEVLPEELALTKRLKDAL